MCTIPSSLLIYLHLIFDILQFEISSLMNWIFFQVWTGFLQATQRMSKIKCRYIGGMKLWLSGKLFESFLVQRCRFYKLKKGFIKTLTSLWGFQNKKNSAAYQIASFVGSQHGTYRPATYGTKIWSILFCFRPITLDFFFFWSLQQI